MKEPDDRQPPPAPATPTNDGPPAALGAGISTIKQLISAYKELEAPTQPPDSSPDDSDDGKDD